MDVLLASQLSRYSGLLHVLRVVGAAFRGAAARRVGRSCCVAGAFAHCRRDERGQQFHELYDFSSPPPQPPVNPFGRIAFAIVGGLVGRVIHVGA